MIDMFRPMRRIKQQLSEGEVLEVLKNAKRGVLSVIGDDGWPYGIYVNPQKHAAASRAVSRRTRSTSRTR